MRVSEYYNLGRGQAHLDFVDIQLDTDLPFFVVPSTLRSLNSQWGHECASLVQDFFETVLNNIRNGDDAKAQRLLSSLNERNDFHLGYSRGKSRGHAFGSKSGKSVWEALSESKAAISGLLQDLEDTCLLIHGIGSDMVSDAVCNIIRGPLIRYTQDICGYYGIPLQSNVDSGPIWNPRREDWENDFVTLPIAGQYGPFVLVPKVIVRHRSNYRFEEYYRHHLLPVMQREEINAGSDLVFFLKNGAPKVTKKSLMAKYGADKLSVVNETIKRMEVFEEYKREKNRNVPLPLEHEELAVLEEADSPNWEEMYEKVVSVPVGRANASLYEDEIEKLLSSLFYPSLCSPTKQHDIHEGRKRIDISYVNEARVGFFAWLSQHYSCPFVFVECKNYGSEVGNPEIDQLSGRFSPSRGKVGILVCRGIANKELLFQRCVDTANDHRGYILPIDDEDLEQIIEHKLEQPDSHEFPLLMKLFMSLVN